MVPLTIVRIWPPGGASCNSWKFGHRVASLALAYCSIVLVSSWVRVASARSCVFGKYYINLSSGVCMGPIEIKLLKISFEVWVRFTSLFNFVVFSCIVHFQCFSLDDMSGWNWHYGGWLPTTQQSEANCPIYALQIFKLLRFEKIYYRERPTVQIPAPAYIKIYFIDFQQLIVSMRNMRNKLNRAK